jgi:hypothetical protein
MYALSLRKLHVLSKSINLIEHHTLITILIGIATLWVVSALLAPSDRQMFTQHAPTRAVSAQAFDIERPLTRLDDPQYAHEYATRAQYLNTHLERLRNTTGADRAYVVSYGYGFSRFGNTREQKISSIFEIGQERFVSQLRYQDLSRENWLHLKRDQHTSGLFPVILRNYGMELFDEHGEAIGYIGLEYLQGNSSLEGNEMKLLQQAAVSIKAALLQPIEFLNNPEEK